MRSTMLAEQREKRHRTIRRWGTSIPGNLPRDEATSLHYADLYRVFLVTFRAQQQVHHAKLTPTFDLVVTFLWQNCGRDVRRAIASESTPSIVHAAKRNDSYMGLG